MVDLSTSYLGIPITNPIIVGSCGLTASVDSVQALEQNGAGAVVLKSIFEEEIALEFEKLLREESPDGRYTDHFDYFDYVIKDNNLKAYSNLIAGCKQAVPIPVIASINCTYSHEWISFAKTLEEAGADAIELNMFFLPSDLSRSSEEQEQAYFHVIERVKTELSLPIALKISSYFSSLGHIIKQLSQTGIDGLVLFNRFMQPDINIDTFQVLPGATLSTPEEHLFPLRWIALMADQIDCDLAASTGIHNGNAVIKHLLAGAQTVQVVSALYKHGNGHLQTMLAELRNWMETKGFERIDQFRGKMSQAHIANPATYERAQYMKQFGSHNAGDEG
ncbi:diguanylate cyclase [candidate division KSB3 bacterium]|uniref:Diguanylate cyclase n=1 Tax=candidate division KSB3 bacterium TaxID=2044937 RepID=A0A2G6K7T1_9BACT|nr:MAG: diguanylate cyclase [candidate division KSB3 bacterium]